MLHIKLDCYPDKDRQILLRVGQSYITANMLSRILDKLPEDTVVADAFRGRENFAEFCLLLRSKEFPLVQSGSCIQDLVVEYSQEWDTAKVRF